jgi:hypothetical protein
MGSGVLAHFGHRSGTCKPTGGGLPASRHRRRRGFVAFQAHRARCDREGLLCNRVSHPSSGAHHGRCGGRRATLGERPGVALAPARGRVEGGRKRSEASEERAVSMGVMAEPVGRTVGAALPAQRRPRTKTGGEAPRLAAVNLLSWQTRAPRRHYSAAPHVFFRPRAAARPRLSSSRWRRMQPGHERGAAMLLGRPQPQR